MVAFSRTTKPVAPQSMHGVAGQPFRCAWREAEGLVEAGGAGIAAGGGQARSARLMPLPMGAAPNAPVDRTRGVGLDVSEPPKVLGLRPAR